jgi:hypothetical protein
VAFPLFYDIGKFPEIPISKKKKLEEKKKKVWKWLTKKTKGSRL